MALPADPTDPTASPPGFAGARISIEQAERLAAAFRPSWEIDEAPFIVAGAGSGGDPMALHTPGTSADVRGAVQALNGTHAPAPATVLMHQEPSSSVIVDGVIAPDAPAPIPAQVGHDRHAQGPAVMAASAPVVMPQQRTLVMTNSPVPAAIAAERRRARTLGLSKVNFRPSRTGLWIAAGAGAGVLVGIVMWLASSPGEPPASSVPPAETTHATTARSPIAPRPPVDTAVTAPAPPPPPTAATTPPAAAAPSAPAVASSPTVTPAQERLVAAPAPQPAPPPRWVPAQPPRPTWTPTTPPPKPLPRPKQGQTIVRDVPF